MHRRSPHAPLKAIRLWRMRRRLEPISELDAALFREAIGPIREIVAPAPAPVPPRPVPRARMRERDEAEALQCSRQQPFALIDSRANEALAYRRDGISERIWRKLRRGQFSVQDEIDLHHQSVASADVLLRSFLLECRERHHLCVRVIHGKGLHSKAGTPVLKNLVETILRRRADVLAYSSAPTAMGGGGAVLVLLSRRQSGEQASPNLRAP